MFDFEDMVWKGLADRVLPLEEAGPVLYGPQGRDLSSGYLKVPAGYTPSRSGLVVEYSAPLAATTRPHTNSDPDRATWYDLTTSERNCALTNFDWTSTSGWTGDGSASGPYRLVFDGIDDRGDFTLPSSAAGDGTYTLEAWLRLSSAPSANGSIVAITNADNTGNVRTALRVTSARQVVLFTMNGSETFTSVYGPAISVGVPHHIVGIVNGASGTLIVDGVAYTGALTSMDGANLVYGTLGCWRWSATSWTEFLRGEVLAARVYDRVLGAQEVNAHYRAGVVASDGVILCPASPAYHVVPASLDSPYVAAAAAGRIPANPADIWRIMGPGDTIWPLTQHSVGYRKRY